MYIVLTKISFTGITSGQYVSGQFIKLILPWLSLGARVLDAMEPKRETVARHVDNMGLLAFPFEVEVYLSHLGLHQSLVTPYTCWSGAYTIGWISGALPPGP